MTDMIAAVLNTGAWLVGLLIITLMAAVPMLERFGTPGRRQ
jgi:hypothetical protein